MGGEPLGSADGCVGVVLEIGVDFSLGDLRLDLSLGECAQPQRLQAVVHGVDVGVVGRLVGIHPALTLLANQHHDFLVFDLVAAGRGQHGIYLRLALGLGVLVGLVFVGKLEALGLRAQHN